ncbi:MAG: HAD-IA family hydrolase [Candidatus Lokiarchaeota archaeon]|nr:HAD-IA family hydrolase [Candidatus Lokiarchaeota archaeon]MBD3338211.1 HAD-IA family hydrolase [Candidatus Lokiarchaeota archaeon]
MITKKKILLNFDLDFTIIDNTIGISNSFNYALNKFNLPPLEGTKIQLMIGTPLEEMFSSVSDSRITELCAAFRDYYGSKGIFEVKLIPGAVKTLSKLRGVGFKLGVITSKKHEMAVKLLKNLNLFDLFSFVLGETEEIRNKSDPKIRALLDNKFPNHKFAVIGDHINDRALAETLNCPFIGVLTGNHSKKQLVNQSKTKTVIVNSIGEISVEMVSELFSNSNLI